MPNLVQQIIDFLLQTPTSTTLIPYIPPILTPPLRNRSFHVQKLTEIRYYGDNPSAIIYPTTPFSHDGFVINPTPPPFTFIQCCNEQILEVKVDFEPASLQNIATILSMPCGFERRADFRLLFTQTESLLDLIRYDGLLETYIQVYPIPVSFFRYIDERPIDIKIEWDMAVHLLITTIVSREIGFEARYLP